MSSVIRPRRLGSSRPARRRASRPRARATRVSASPARLVRLARRVPVRWLCCEGHEERLPPRPVIPLALWALLLACVVVRGVSDASFGLEQEQLRRATALAASLVAVLLLAALWLFARVSEGLAPSLVVLAVVGSLAGCVACVHATGLHAQAALLGSRAPSQASFTMLSDTTRGAHGLRGRGRAYLDGRAVGEVWLTGSSLPQRGVRFSCVGRFRPLAHDDYGRSSWRQGICGSVSVLSVKEATHARGLVGRVWSLRERKLALIKPTAGAGRALVAGCVCGSREALDASGLTDAFAACGIAHLIAVSGSHLSLLALALSQLLDRTRLSQCTRLLLLAALTGLFVLFCGVPVSALRAWFMSLVAFGAQLVGRRAHALSAVSVVGLAMLLMEPSLVGQLGFELSLLSVIGLCVLAPHASYLVRVVMPTPPLPRRLGYRGRRLMGKALEGVRAAFALSAVCQLVTLPVTCAVFGRLSLVAPLANVLAAPLLSVVLVLGALACLLAGVAPLSRLALDACDAIAGRFAAVLVWMSKMPYASISTAGLAGWASWVVPLVVLVWALWWPRITRARAYGALALALALGACLFVRLRYAAPARIVVLDIGQGDAILIQDGGSTLLVDTGPDAAVVQALARNHVLHLDAVVLTHLHDDHIGGLDDLVGIVPCDQVMVARGVASHVEGALAQACQDLTGRGPLEIGLGDVLRVGNFALCVVWPQAAVEGDENSESLELLATYHSQGKALTALLTGDAEQDEMAQILERGSVGDLDLLKVGHHGSEVSLTSEQAVILDPELSVASAGEGNSYGHPRPECVQVLQDTGSLFFCTKDVGDVEVRPAREGITVRAPCRIVGS